MFCRHFSGQRSFSNKKVVVAKITSFHSNSWVKIRQIPQKLLNDHFANAIIQKVIKTKIVNIYRAY